MRYSSLDLLRTFAVCVMVLVHFGENLAGFTAPFAGMGAPLFTFLSGMSYALWLNGQYRKGTNDETISRISVRRGLFVFGTGFAFNILIWLPEDVFNWDVLTFIGAALLLLTIVRNLPLIVPLLMAFCIWLFSPFLRRLAAYDEFWTNGYFDPDPTLTDITSGFLVTGYFPLLPWLAFPLTGFAVGRYCFRETAEATDKESRLLTLRAPLLAGIGMLAAGSAALITGNQLPGFSEFLGGFTMFPASAEYTCMALGAALAAFAVLHRTVDLQPEPWLPASVLRLAEQVSRYSFTIYILHHCVHLWPLWAYAALQGQEATSLWMQAMPLWSALLLALLFLAATGVALMRVGRSRRWGMEATMRWLCDE